VKDGGYVAVFVVAGVVLAVAASRPLHRSDKIRPHRMEDVPALSEKDTRSYVEGTVSLAPDISPELASSRVLFIIARPVNGSVPIAVKRFPSPVFPLAFSLTNANNMAGTDFYDGELSLMVRLDADGMAGPKRADDIEADATVDPKSRQVQIELTR
jgi:hypothetical protein